MRACRPDEVAVNIYGDCVPRERATLGIDMDPLDRKLAEINGRIDTLGRQYRALDALFGRMDEAERLRVAQERESIRGWQALNTRIARLERRHVQDDLATAEGKRLLGSLLVLIGRRLRNEDAKHN